MKMWNPYDKIEFEHPDYILAMQLNSSLGPLAKKHGLTYRNQMITSDKKVLTVKMLKDVKGKSNFNARTETLYLSLRDSVEHDTVWSLIRKFFGR